MKLPKVHRVIAGVQHPVIAAYNPENLTGIKLVAHTCGNCNTKALVNPSKAAACPVCATVMEPDTAQSVEITKPELETMEHLATCSACNTSFASTEATAKKLIGNTIHCTVCANEMEITEEPSLEDEELVTDDLEEVSEEDAEIEASDSEEDPSEVEELETETEIEEEIPEEELTASSKKRKKVISSEESEEIPEEVEEVEDEEVMEEDVDAVATVKFNPLTYALANKANMEFDIVMAGTTKNPIWYLFGNSRPIATASYLKASDKAKSIFATAKYADAVSAIIAGDESGAPAALEEMGMEPIETDIPVDDITKHQVEEAVSTATAALNSERATAIAKIERCIGIAAVGITKNVFRDVSNPLREAFISKLKTVAVRQPEALVDSIFAQHGEEFLRAVISKGLALTSKPDVALDEVADMVDSVEYKETSVASVVEGNNNPRSFPFIASGGSDKSGNGEADIAEKRTMAVASLGRRKI